jgi:chondroitin AC lyase
MGAPAAVVLSVQASVGVDGGDMATVKSRMLSDLLPSQASEATAIKAAHTLAAKLQPNGTWPDIDYHEFRRAGWPMVEHLTRVSQLAAAWRGGTNASSDSELLSLLASTRLALDLWLKNDWKNPNWYDNEIGVPRQMGDIGLLLQPALSSEESSKMEEIMSRADWKGSGTDANPKWTGANLLDMLRIQIHRGLFVNSTSLVKQGFARSFAAVVHKHQDEDSIMVDNSFHQHGPQLLAAAYGAVFTSDILDLACLSASTEFQMPAPAIAVFEGLVLDGQARMSRAGTWDWQVHGRGISIASGLEIGFSADRMRIFADHVSPRRGNEWRSFAHRIDADDASTSAAVIGNRGFWSSDYMTHGQREFLFTIHMFSARTIPAACVNEQGKHRSTLKLRHAPPD